jgi:predicted permease
MFETLWQDVRYALRGLRRAPGFTATVVVTLALGIGANTTIFSVINGVLLKPLPYPDPDRLVGVWHDAPGLNATDFPMSASLYVTYREQNRSFEDIGLWDDTTSTVTGKAEPEQLETLLVTDGTLALLGVTPVLGRRFTAEDVAEGSPDTVMVTYDYWQNGMGGDASVLGRRLMVNARPREVIGVLPRNFRFLDQRPALLVPIKIAKSQLILGLFNYQAVARLKPAISLAQANADLARLLPIWARSFPPAPGFSSTLFDEARITPDIRPFKQDAIGSVGSVLWIVMATVGVVLLMACANVANLLLVRAEGRRQDVAVRLALGAGRGRVARELLSESLVLGLAGGVAGIIVASTALRLLVRIGPTQLPRLQDISLDPTVLIFALAISLVSGLLFGLIPVLKYGTSRNGIALQAGSRTSHSREHHTTRSALVVAQVALALVLLISAGLMIRTFQNLREVHPGFTTPEDVQTFRIQIPGPQLGDPEQVVRMQHAILDRITAIAGVASASFAQSVPMDGRTDHDPVVVQDRPDADRQMTHIRTYNFVAPGFSRVIGNRFIAGRDFTWTDVYERRPVVLISENLARELWGEPVDAIGKRIRENLNGPWREIVGIVGDLRDEGIDKKAPPMVYWPTLLNGFLGQDIMVKRSIAFVIRTNRAGTGTLHQELQEAVWAVNRELPLAEMRTLGEIYDRSMARTAFTLVMLAIAGAMALLLGLVGIYAVMSSSVSQRTREIGIRIALGAQRSQVIAPILRYSLALTITGIAIGLAVAATLTRVLDGVLFGVTPLDPATFLVMSMALISVSILAAHLPARRAARLDPMAVLRIE